MAHVSTRPRLAPSLQHISCRFKSNQIYPSDRVHKITWAKLLNDGWFGVVGVMIGEDLQKFSGSRVIRTIAIGRVPMMNLPNYVKFISISGIL
ncbi:hypothetical protein AVEN_34129-1 [Araneus ventricosus]|uniref:Uncharacterized protein n=1 Tax=Araneus ventricosus TaxID=182803 RepID=A0A4Y2RCI6_ARAVE|nr:hypothetical protein AVEN_34129-1 [Araneus ventricosus]